MMGWIVRMIGGAIRGASMHCHPSALALASAFGLAIGLMPKDNLFVVSLAAIACFVRMNYLLAVITAVVVSYGAFWTDALTGEIGKWMLESSQLQSLWMRIAVWPIMPWFRWNNTVVLGSFLVGLGSFVPTYFIYAIVSRRLSLFQTQSQVDAIVEKVSDYQIQIRAEKNKRQLVKANIESNTERRRSIKKRQNQLHRIDETQHTEAIKPNVVTPRPEPAMAMMTADLPLHDASAVLHETVIEIVRYRPKSQSLPSKSDDSNQPLRDPVKPATPMNTNAIDPAFPSSTNTSSDSSEQRTATLVSNSSHTNAHATDLPIVHEGSGDKPREEALRYLLWHLSGMHRQPRHQEPVS